MPVVFCPGAGDAKLADELKHAACLQAVCMLGLFVLTAVRPNRHDCPLVFEALSPSLTQEAVLGPMAPSKQLA